MNRRGLAAVDGLARGALLDVRHAAATRTARARGNAPGRTAPQSAGDPFSPVVLVSPERWYRDLHASGPVNYCAARDIWIINGYHEVRAAARAHEVLSSADGTARFRARLPMLVAMDRPEHARLRRILARDFTKDRAGQFQGLVRKLANRAIDRVVAERGADIYPTLAGPIPLDVIAGVLDVPDAKREALRRWSSSTVAIFMADLNLSGLKLFGRFLADVSDLFTYFETLIEERRRRPGEDAISRLVTYDDEQGPLTTEEMLWFILMLLVAGNETTTSVMMAVLCALGRDPEQYELLRHEPERIPQAVEEGVRWASPVPAFFRTARSEYAAGGVTIPPDGRVMLHFAAANRDPARFPEPDRFDLRRRFDEHVGFGSGIHFCLGAHVARVELTVLLQALTERVERLEMLGEPIWRPNASLRGIESMQMRFHASQAR